MVKVLLTLTRYDIVAFRGRRRTLCGFGGVEVRFSRQALGIVRLQGVAEVTFRGRCSTLCVSDVWTHKFSWQAQGTVRRVAVEVNVAVDERWNRETAWQGCLMCVLRWGFPLDFLEEVSYKRLGLQTRSVSF